MTETTTYPKAPSRKRGETRLRKSQQARIEALIATRDLLGAKSQVLGVAAQTQAVDPIDLVNVASWVMNGVDPWEPKATLASNQEDHR